MRFLCILKTIGRILKGLIKINFPENCVEVRTEGDQKEIFCVIRKQWLSFTPEEWVRQHIIQYLIASGYPSSLIAVEKKILLPDNLTKRADIVVYGRDTNPFMIIECKRMEVPLSEKVLEQVLRYHIPLQPPYLIITNGLYTMGLKKGNNRFTPINYFPLYLQ